MGKEQASPITREFRLTSQKYSIRSVWKWKFVKMGPVLIILGVWIIFLKPEYELETDIH